MAEPDGCVYHQQPMNNRSHVTWVRVYPLSIPMRRPFRHAASERCVADPIVVEIELADGTRGYGETLPRPYVSGESNETVITSIRDTLLDELVTLRPSTFPDALERIEAMPAQDELGRVMTAARAGVELALLDAYSRHFQKPISEAVGWMGFAGFGPSGSSRHVRYSGVLSAGEPRRLRRKVWLMRLFGLRDFKLKVGLPDDIERVRTVAAALGSSLGRMTRLRLDANGAWSVATASEVLKAVTDVPIDFIEQPLARRHDVELVRLRKTINCRIMHDESLVTRWDAERLLKLGLAEGFNIRLSKNGGFLPALQLANFARRNGISFQLGCMVGETSILSAAGQRFIENVPGIMFAEGSYGRFLLKGDVVERPVRLGYGGQPRPLPGPGWGIEVRRELLERYATAGVLEMPL